MNQAVIVTIGVLAFLLLAVLCMRAHGPAIEADLHDATRERMAQAGIDWIDVVLDGRDATVRGFAANAAGRETAQTVLAGIAGLRRVNNEIQLRDEVFSPASAPQTFETRVMISSGFVRYTGFMPDDEHRRRLIGQTRALFPNRQVEDETYDLAAAPPNWMDAMRTLQQRFATYVSGDAVISGNRLDVVAEVPPGREDESRILAARLPPNFVTGITINVARGASVENCQRSLDQLLQTRINFRLASDIIDPASHAALDDLARRIKECGSLRIEVAGHTDAEGLATKNLALSQRRAEAVVAYLVNQGIPADRLVPWGYGESRPIADNASAAGRAANRRIEFRAMN